MKKFRCAIVAGFAVLAFFHGGQAKADSVSLRVADSLPLNHYIVQEMTLHWMDEVKKRSNGAVTFNHFPAQQIGKGKDYLSLTTSGVADVAYLMPSIMTEKLPLSTVADLPLNYSDPCDATKAFYKLSTGDGLLAQKEYAPQGVRVLMALVLPQNEVFLTRPNVKSLADISGLKVRATSGPRERTIQNLGASAISMPSTEMPEAIRRGTIDGTIMLASSISDYDLTNVIKSWTSDLNLGGLVVVYVTSEQRWKSLSPEAQKLMAEVGYEMSVRACAAIDRTEKRTREKFVTAIGKPINFTDEERKTVRTRLDAIAARWASEQDSRNAAGTKVLKAFEEALKL